MEITLFTFVMEMTEWCVQSSEMSSLFYFTVKSELPFGEAE